MLKRNYNLARKKAKNKYYFFNNLFKKDEYYRLFRRKASKSQSNFSISLIKNFFIYLLTMLFIFVNPCWKKDFPQRIFGSKDNDIVLLSAIIQIKISIKIKKPSL